MLNELKISGSKFESEGCLALFDKNIYPYQYFNFCKPPIEGYSGTALLSKYEPINIKYDLGLEKHD